MSIELDLDNDLVSLSSWNSAPTKEAIWNNHEVTHVQASSEPIVTAIPDNNYNFQNRQVVELCYKGDEVREKRELHKEDGWLKTFWKKHKKAIIITTVVVVAVTIIVVVTVATCGTATTAGSVVAGGAGIGKAATSGDDDKKDTSPAKSPQENRPSSNPQNPASSPDNPHRWPVDPNFGKLDEPFRLCPYTPFSPEYYVHVIQDLNKTIATDRNNPNPYLERGIANFHLGYYDQAVVDYRQYAELQKAQPFSTSDFCLGFAKGLPKGIYESGRGLLSFVSNAALHPIQTGKQIHDSFNSLSNLVGSREWKTLSKVLAPEVHQLVRDWKGLSSIERGERSAYIFGKYGADIFMPGALTKAVSKGTGVVQTINTVTRGLQTAERTYFLESIARLESSAKIAEIVKIESRISGWLGEGTQLIRNKAQDPVFLSKDGLRRLRFDFNNPHGDKLHLHIEEKVGGKWKDVSSQHRIYPIDAE